jgi:AAA domain-containing protein
MPTTPYNLDLVSYEKLCVLIYGPYGSGKTHLQGDFLRWARAKGDVAFVNIRGEDGDASIGQMGLGNIGYRAESVKDFEAIMGALMSKKLVGLAIDSLTGYYELALLDKYGKIRYPDPKLDGEAAKNHWGQLNMGLKDAVVRSRAVAPYVLWVAPHDRSDDTVGSGKGLTPNLPGKLAYECAGRFDFVGHLRAETLSPTRIKRSLTFAPATGMLTRQRSPTAITQELEIPEGGGGWANFMTAVEAAFKKEAKNG